MLNLSDELCGILHRGIVEQQRYSSSFGTDYCNDWDGYLMRYQDGKIIPPNAITQHFQLFLVKNHLKKIRFHDLRHSCASLLFANGVDILTIQEILGHAQLTTTIAYTHKINDNKSKALTQMSNQFLQASSEEKGGFSKLIEKLIEYHILRSGLTIASSKRKSPKSLETLRILDLSAY